MIDEKWQKKILRSPHPVPTLTFFQDGRRFGPKIKIYGIILKSINFREKSLMTKLESILNATFFIFKLCSRSNGSKVMPQKPFQTCRADPSGGHFYRFTQFWWVGLKI